jgi:hypothetical protein
MTEYKELGHLGDGVYLSDDGYHLWLAVGHHESKVVALDPDVALALVQAILKHQYGSVIKKGVLVRVEGEKSDG